MEKKQVLFNFIERVIFLLASIQVFLGLIWAGFNVTYVPRFEESKLFLQASRDFVLDEYMGILYPLILRMTSVAGSGFCVVLYLLQLMVAFGAYNYFLKTVFSASFAQKKKERYLLAAYIVTFPVILQVHMCVLPYSLASSMLMLMMAQLKKLLSAIGPMPVKTVVSMGVFWGIGTLILPDYGVITGIVVAIGFVVYAWKKERRWRVLLLTAFIAITCVGGTLTLTQTPGSLGRIQKSMGSVMLSRFAWPYLERNGFFWSEEVKEVFSAGDLRGISLYPERIIYEFGPRLEEAVGRERANELYWQMAVDSFSVGKRDALVVLGNDILLNAGGPVGIQIQWLGKGVSYAGWNYARLSEYAPALTKYYVRFASYGYDFMLLLMLVMWLLQRKLWKVAGNKTFRRLTVLLLGIVMIWYTMTGSNMQDYIKVIPINIFWCLLPVWGYVMCAEHTRKE